MCMNKPTRDKQISQLRDFRDMLNDIRLRATMLEKSIASYMPDHAMDEDIEEAMKKLADGSCDAISVSAHFITSASVETFLTHKEEIRQQACDNETEQYDQQEADHKYRESFHATH